MNFSYMIIVTSVSVFASLFLYMIYLLRSGRLSAHTTVRWVLAELAALCMILLWGRLPFFSYTSTLGDRELLVILAVILFALFSFLIMELLVQLNKQGNQIVRLAQEVSILRAKNDELELTSHNSES